MSGSGVYSVEDLLKLRASPLIAKPPNLPPIEEWMGAQEPVARRLPLRGKPDDVAIQSESLQKKPPLLENQRRSTDPDRIVLGPPRRSFASASARSGKILEGTEELSQARDRTSFHEKSRNGDVPDAKSYERRSYGRHGNRQDGEDPETDPRRENDRRPKWAGREKHDYDKEDDWAVDDAPRTTVRREVHSRAKLSQSWFRKDTGEAPDDSRRDPDTRPAWRQGDRARDRDWDRDRSAKAEADPEWMDSNEPEDAIQVHTQEDFQRWKERMKAGGAAPLDTVDNATAADPAKPSKKVASPEPDDSMDKFFAKFEAKSTDQKATSVKVHGKTRFASLFGPPPPTGTDKAAAPPPMPPTATPPIASTVAATTDADQAGFARILEMLQTRSNNPSPQASDESRNKSPLHPQSRDAGADVQGRPPSRDLLSLLAVQNAPALSSQMAASPLKNDRPIDSRSPVDHLSHTRQQPSYNKDEGLLKLLRQANLAPKPAPPPPPHQHLDLGPGPGPGPGYGAPDYNQQVAARNQMIAPLPGHDLPPSKRRDPGRPLYDEPPYYQGEPDMREQMGKPPTNATPQQQEDALLTFLGRHAPPQPRPGQVPQGPPGPQGLQGPLPPGLPPGLHRPPGLDQLPRPGPNWPPPPPPSQQVPRPQGMPPGLSNMPRGMPMPPFGHPQQPPQQRPQHQRKYTGDANVVSPVGMPSLPPGMYPPPGFMNAAPPPGHPNHPPGRFPGEPGPPPAMNRAFVDMYGDVAGRGGGLRGTNGNGGIPPYR